MNNFRSENFSRHNMVAAAHPQSSNDFVSAQDPIDQFGRGKGWNFLRSTQLLWMNRIPKSSVYSLAPLLHLKSECVLKEWPIGMVRILLSILMIDIFESGGVCRYISLPRKDRQCVYGEMAFICPDSTAINHSKSNVSVTTSYECFQSDLFSRFAAFILCRPKLCEQVKGTSTGPRWNRNSFHSFLLVLNCDKIVFLWIFMTALRLH